MVCCHQASSPHPNPVPAQRNWVSADDGPPQMGRIQGRDCELSVAHDEAVRRSTLDTGPVSRTASYRTHTINKTELLRSTKVLVWSLLRSTSGFGVRSWQASGSALLRQEISDSSQINSVPKKPCNCFDYLNAMNLRQSVVPFISRAYGSPHGWLTPARSFGNAGYEFGASDADVTNLIDANLVGPWAACSKWIKGPAFVASSRPVIAG